MDTLGNWAERDVTMQILEITDDDDLGEVDVGEFVNHVFQCSGCGLFENRWKVISGALPPGLTLTDTGQLYGTPTTAGSYQFEIGIDCS
jgi:hypothetical protein